MTQKPAKTFQDLVVWQKAHQWVIEIYRLTEKFPNHEKYGLSSQLRRSAVSVPANIAEGFRKWSDADKNRYLNIAQGSLEESRYYLILSNDLDYGDTQSLQGQLEEVSRLLYAYAKSVRNKKA